MNDESNQALRRLLAPGDDRTVGTPEGWAAVVEGAQRRRRRRRAVAIGVPIVCLMVLAGALAVIRSDGPTRVETGVAERSSVGDGGTGTVLVVDDGAGGVNVIDVDRGVAKSVPLVDDASQTDLQRPTTLRLALAGDRLAYQAGGQAASLPLALEGPTADLGAATYMLPSGDDRSVWLGSQPVDSGGRHLISRVSPGSGTEAEVGPIDVPTSDVAGATFAATPQVASEDRILLSFANEVRAWDPATGVVTPFTSEIDPRFMCSYPASALTRFFVAASSDAGPCGALLVLDGDGFIDVRMQLPSYSYLSVGRLTPNPTGDHVALLQSAREGDGGVVGIADLRDGSIRDVVKFAGAPSLAWSKDGQTLFVTGYTDDSTTTILAFDISNGSSRVLNLPVSMNGDAVALTVDDIDLGPPQGSCSANLRRAGSGFLLPTEPCTIDQTPPSPDATLVPTTASPPPYPATPPEGALTGPTSDGSTWFVWRDDTYGLCVATNTVSLGCDVRGNETEPARSEPRLAGDPNIGDPGYGFVAYGYLPDGMTDVTFVDAVGRRSSVGVVYDEEARIWAMPIVGNVRPVAVDYSGSGAEISYPFGAETP